MKLRWYRYTVVIVGTESGHRSELPFLRFRSYTKAREWCIRLNNVHNEHAVRPLVYYEAARIP